MLTLLLLAACDLPLPDALPGAPTAATAPPAAPADPVDTSALAARYRLGAAVTVDALTVWPVLDTHPEADTGALPLSAALAAGTATVTERGGGEVPTLTLTNTGDRPVLAMAGDVVLGGRQDRILAATVLVAPHSTIDVAVNCVEQGRWHGQGEDRFAYGGRGELDLRKTVRTAKDQGATWSKVAEVNAEKQAYVADDAKADLAPASGTYRASLKTAAVDARVRPAVGPLVARLEAEADAVGFVAAIGADLQGIELYGSPSLFAAVRADAVRSVVVEAIGARPAPPPTDAAATAFLVEALSGPVVARAAAGRGAAVETSSERTSGFVVVDEQGKLLQAAGYTK